MKPITTVQLIQPRASGLFIILILLGSFMMPACTSSPSREDLNRLIRQGVIGKTFYLRHALYSNRRIHSTLNLHAGHLYPINTPVMVLDLNKKVIRLKIGGGDILLIRNDMEFSRQSLGAIFERTLSDKPVSLSGLSPLELEYIRHGRVAKGMRKRAVIMAYGYPPYFRTESLESDRWVYWQDRRQILHLIFRDGILREIMHR